MIMNVLEEHKSNNKLTYDTLTALALVLTLPCGSYHTSFINNHGSNIIKMIEYLLNNAQKEDMQKVSKNTVKSLLASVNTIRSRTDGH